MAGVCALWGMGGEAATIERLKPVISNNLFPSPQPPRLSSCDLGQPHFSDSRTSLLNVSVSHPAVLMSVSSFASFLLITLMYFGPGLYCSLV